MFSDIESNGILQAQEEGGDPEQQVQTRIHQIIINLFVSTLQKSYES